VDYDGEGGPRRRWGSSLRRFHTHAARFLTIGDPTCSQAIIPKLVKGPLGIETVCSNASLAEFEADELLHANNNIVVKKTS